MKINSILIFTAGIIFAVTVCHADNTDFNKANLQQQLVQAFTNNYDINTSHAQAGKLAIKCTGANYSPTNLSKLYSALTNEFAKDKLLAWDTNQSILTNDASRVAAFFFNDKIAKTPSGIDEDQLAQEIFKVLGSFNRDKHHLSFDS